MRWFPTGSLARSAYLGMLWQSARIFFQGLWVVMVARVLGPDGYGTFAGIVGLATTMGGLVGLGQGLIMYRDVVREPLCFSNRWRRSMGMSLATGVLLGALFLYVGATITGPAEWSIFFAVAVAELLCFPIVTTACFAFAAHERIGWSAGLPALLAASRLAAVAAFLYAEGSGLSDYARFHAIGTALFTGLSVLLVHRVLRPANVPFAIFWRDIVDGISYSAVWAMGNTFSSLDKALVLRFSGSDIAGIYSSTYRFATIIAVPMDALVTAAMPRLFRIGDSAATQRNQLLFTLALTISFYGLLAGLALWAAADLLPAILGADFASTAGAAKVMSFFLPFYGMRLLGANIMIAMGLKRERILVDFGGIVILTCLSAWLLPRFGLNGALYVAIAIEALLSFAMWVILLGSALKRNSTNPPCDHA